MNPTSNTIPNSNTIPHGYDQIVATYGNPAGHNGNANPAWEAANIVAFTPPYPFVYVDDAGAATPVSHFRVHRLIVPDLAAILTDVYNAARQLVKASDGVGQTKAYYDKRTLEVLQAHRCDVFSGSYVFRDKRGQSVPSDHAFGVALDFDANHNAFGSQRGTLPDWFIKAFTDRGWEWGGQWQGSNKDWMHFQRCTGY